MSDDRLDAMAKAVAATGIRRTASRRQVFRGLLGGAGGGALLLTRSGRVAAVGKPNRCTEPKDCAERCREGTYGNPPVERDRCMVTCLNAGC